MNLVIKLNMLHWMLTRPPFKIRSNKEEQWILDLRWNDVSRILFLTLHEIAKFYDKSADVVFVIVL